MIKDCIYQLRSCVWEITTKCCFSCEHCGSRAGTERANELTTAECIDVAKQLADIGCTRVSLIGGEVFMRPDWMEIIKALTDRNISVSIITNGYMISDKIITEIKACNVESVAVSIDGVKELHDKQRTQGSYEFAINAIDKLSEASIPVSVITTLHSGNVNCLDEMFNILKDKNIFAWQLQACSPMGNASRGKVIDNYSTDFDFRKVLDFVEINDKNPHFVVGVADNIGYYTESEGKIRGSVQAPFLGCKAGLTSIGIDSIGNVRGCESMYDEFFIEGNLRERTLYEIWSDPNAFAYNRQFTIDMLSGKCRDCQFGSRCAGGCRSYNYFTHKKMYESPMCAKWRNYET